MNFILDSPNKKRKMQLPLQKKMATKLKSFEERFEALCEKGSKHVEALVERGSKHVNGGIEALCEKGTKHATNTAEKILTVVNTPLVDPVEIVEELPAFVGVDRLAKEMFNDAKETVLAFLWENRPRYQTIDEIRNGTAVKRNDGVGIDIATVTNECGQTLQQYMVQRSVAIVTSINPVASGNCEPTTVTPPPPKKALGDITNNGTRPDNANVDSLTPVKKLSAKSVLTAVPPISEFSMEAEWMHLVHYRRDENGVGGFRWVNKTECLGELAHQEQPSQASYLDYRTARAKLLALSPTAKRTFYETAVMALNSVMAQHPYDRFLTARLRDETKTLRGGCGKAEFRTFFQTYGVDLEEERELMGLISATVSSYNPLAGPRAAFGGASNSEDFFVLNRGGVRFQPKTGTFSWVESLPRFVLQAPNQPIVPSSPPPASSSSHTSSLHQPLTMAVLTPAHFQALLRSYSTLHVPADYPAVPIPSIGIPTSAVEPIDLLSSFVDLLGASDPEGQRRKVICLHHKTGEEITPSMVSFMSSEWVLYEEARCEAGDEDKIDESRGAWRDAEVRQMSVWQDQFGVDGTVKARKGSAIADASLCEEIETFEWLDQLDISQLARLLVRLHYGPVETLILDTLVQTGPIPRAGLLRILRLRQCPGLTRLEVGSLVRVTNGHCELNKAMVRNQLVQLFEEIMAGAYEAAIDLTAEVGERDQKAKEKAEITRQEMKRILVSIGQPKTLV